MDPPVNFDNLHVMTGGDQVLEAELFRVFLDSSAECISALRTACAVGDDTAWKKEAHAFKGICLNLGAGPLGELCRKAQDDCRALPDEKEKMLVAMEEELARVRQAVGEA